MTPNVTIRPVRAGEWRLVRDVRLRSLADSPEAFGASLSDESEMPDAAWIERTEGSALGGDAAAFIAEGGAGWVGFVMARLDYDDPARAGMFGLWVDPASRATGIGRALTESVIAWTAAKGARSLTLWVVAGNVAAVELYRRCGFSATGDSMPMPRKPELLEIRMSRRFAAPAEVNG